MTSAIEKPKKWMAHEPLNAVIVRQGWNAATQQGERRVRREQSKEGAEQGERRASREQSKKRPRRGRRARRARRARRRARRERKEKSKEGSKEGS